MALHPEFPQSPYAVLLPDQRWFPAAEELRSTAYEKLLPPLVANIREEVEAWRDGGYAGASPTSRALLRWWFEAEHLVEQADGTLSRSATTSRSAKPLKPLSGSTTRAGCRTSST